MKHTLPTKPLLLVFFLFFCTTAVFAQLPNFTLTVTPTPQTCVGNGALSFVVAGNNPLASIDYNIYLLPNTTTAVATVTTPTVGGLTAGNYLVVATQSLNGQSNTSEVNVTIADNILPLDFDLTPTNVRCGNDGVITVNVLAGTAVSYEITSGPVTVAPQASNVFNNLPVGTYNVKVNYSTCGAADVLSIQLTQQPTSINIGGVSFPSAELPSCNTIQVAHSYFSNPNQNIFYPLTFQYTVFPPGGGTPTVINQTVSGGPNQNQIISTLPFYHDQQYSYNLTITNACGTVYVRNNNIVNRELTILQETEYPNCDDTYFALAPVNYVGPFTLDFTDAPDDFDANDFNTAYPNFDSTVVIFGGAGNTVPLGDYTVTLTDACGRSTQLEFEITAPDISPAVTTAALCGEVVGNISIVVPDRDITSVLVNIAPTGYPSPADVSSAINSFGAFEIFGVPLGLYEFFITDSCGDTYTETVNLQPNGGDPLLGVIDRPGCAEGEGSIRLAADGDLVTVSITDAPQEFIDSLTQPLPYDVSANIVTSGLPANIGMFFMGSLPEGTYTFYTVDSCNTIREQDVVVTGYAVTVNDFTVIQNCGSFDLDMHHTSNGMNASSFWLQRLNPLTGVWGHPETGVPYADNSLPSNANSKMLTNNSININNDYLGQFRVLKVFYTYGDGTATQTRCIQELYDFEFDDRPEIIDIYGFPCSDGTSEIIVDAIGVAPLTYSITEKDGEPFPVPNGTSNLFSGLEPGIYTFQVTDVCGNVREAPENINTLDPVAIEETGFCEGEDSALTIQEFSFLSYQWYREGAPTAILSTTGTLLFPDYNSGTDAGDYVLVITSTNPNSCLNQTITYPVLPNTLPNAGTDNSAELCNTGGLIDLNQYLATGHDTGGTWQDVNNVVTLTGSQLDTDGLASGIYNFSYTVTGNCSLTDAVTITLQLKDIPAAPVMVAVPQLCEGQDIVLSATGVPPTATYQWSGPNGFTSSAASPTIQNAGVAAAGSYSLTVALNGCPSPASVVPVTVRAIPQFTVQGSTSLCEGQTAILSVVPTEPANFDVTTVTFEWYYNGSLQTGATQADVEISEVGLYSVIVNNGNCASVPQQIPVLRNTNAFTVQVEGGCKDYTYVISVINADDLPGALYSWTGPEGFSFNGPEADITDLATGDYIVTVINADGCTATATLPVDNTSCIIPKGLSPNMDGLNDSFDLSNLDVRDIKIFNRYGMQVYEKQNYVNEWMGQSDKGDLPVGTYYYVLTLSAGTKVTGWVYLQREFN